MIESYQLLLATLLGHELVVLAIDEEKAREVLEVESIKMMLLVKVLEN